MNTPLAEQIVERYQHQRARGRMRLDEKVLKEQESAKTAERAQQLKARTQYSESDLYSMSMDELRQKAAEHFADLEG